MSSTERILAKNRLIEAAVKVLAGELDLMAGVMCLLRDLGVLKLELESEYLVFSAFYSETDHLPTAETRHLWSSTPLAEKDLELKEIADRYRDEILHACQKLISYLKTQNY